MRSWGFSVMSPAAPRICIQLLGTPPLPLKVSLKFCAADRRGPGDGAFPNGFPAAVLTLIDSKLAAPPS